MLRKRDFIGRSDHHLRAPARHFDFALVPFPQDFLEGVGLFGLSVNEKDTLFFPPDLVEIIEQFAAIGVAAEGVEISIVGVGVSAPALWSPISHTTSRKHREKPQGTGLPCPRRFCRPTSVKLPMLYPLTRVVITNAWFSYAWHGCTCSIPTFTSR